MENPNNNVMEIDDGPGQASGSGANGPGVVKADPDASPKTSTGPEGKVGKLVFYKSGKCKLKIGDIYFDVSFMHVHPLLFIGFSLVLKVFWTNLDRTWFRKQLPAECRVNRF